MRTTEILDPNESRFETQILNSTNGKVLEIEIKGDVEEHVYLSLLNSFGQCVYTQKGVFNNTNTTIKVDVSIFKPGLYFLSMIKGGNILRRYIQVP